MFNPLSFFEFQLGFTRAENAMRHDVSHDVFAILQAVLNNAILTVNYFVQRRRILAFGLDVCKLAVMPDALDSECIRFLSTLPLVIVFLLAYRFSGCVFLICVISSSFLFKLSFNSFANSALTYAGCSRFVAALVSPCSRITRRSIAADLSFDTSDTRNE